MILSNRHITIFKLMGIIVGSVAGFFAGVGIPNLMFYISVWGEEDKTGLGGIFPFILIGAAVGPIIGLIIGYQIANKLTKKHNKKQNQRLEPTRYDARI